MSLSEELRAAANAAHLAKMAHRSSPTADTRQAHRDASEELRYTRWLARGGPAAHEQALADWQAQADALHAAGFDTTPMRTGPSHVMYERWLAEKQGG